MVRSSAFAVHATANLSNVFASTFEAETEEVHAPYRNMSQRTSWAALLGIAAWSASWLPVGLGRTSEWATIFCYFYFYLILLMLLS
jgi:hypothetical protein